MEELRDMASLTSLALTVPTLCGCFGVVWLWHRSAWRAWSAQHKTETHYFIIGVVIGFAGSMFDNAYWFVAWYADYAHLDIRDELFRNGAYPNVLFRQIATATAAAFHIRAAVASSSIMFRVWVLGAWLAGLLLAAVLYNTAGGPQSFGAIL